MIINPEYSRHGTWAYTLRDVAFYNGQGARRNYTTFCFPDSIQIWKKAEQKTTKEDKRFVENEKSSLPEEKLMMKMLEEISFF